MYICIFIYLQIIIIQNAYIYIYIHYMLHITTHNNNNTCNFMIDIYTIYIYWNGKPTMQLFPSNTRCLEVEDETWTVLAIGPDASKKIDMVTGTPSGMAHCFWHVALFFFCCQRFLPEVGTSQPFVDP